MPIADSASKPNASTARVWLLAPDALTRQLLGLLLQRLGAAPPAMLDDLGQASAVLRAPDDGLLLVAIDTADAEGLAPLRALVSASRAQARSGPRVVALVRDDADATHCRDAGADATLIRPPRLAALRALLQPALPASESAPEPAQFDPAALQALHRLYGDAGIAEVIDALQTDLPVQQARVDAAIAAGDSVGLGRVAHALRGISLQIGAEALAAGCSETETLANCGSFEAAAAAAKSMMTRHAALVAAVSKAAVPAQPSEHRP